ncbi:MAG: rhodanese-like domain-containing protein [Pseudomonadota bacterium]|nr:MAG: rhodanese-like domain-containing protein [Pseudomonadota bacterium]
MVPIEQYIEFAQNHMLLVGALVVTLAMLTHNLLGSRLRGFKSVSPAEATQLINREDAVVLDVREDNEYHTGHILNSVHIPLGRVKSRLGELEQYRNKPVIVGCRSGSRSGHVCSVLKKSGFESVYNLGGGIMAWQNANLPVSKK